MEKKEIIETLEKAYDIIDKGLDSYGMDKIEYEVAKGMDYILEVIRKLKEGE